MRSQWLAGVANSSVYYKKLAVTFVRSLGWLSKGEKRGEGCREEGVEHEMFLCILNTMQVCVFVCHPNNES